MVSNQYRAIMSHDIDFVTKLKSFRNVLGATRRQGNFLKQYNKFFKIKRNRRLDPYWTMEAMLEQNNSYNIETQFYFMSGKSNTKYDLNDYHVDDPDIKSLMRSLKKNGAKIGLHPSYNSFNDYEIIKKEKDTLENALGEIVNYSRQHYLRYQEPLTFKLLAKAGIKQDSSVGFRKKIELTTEANLPYVIYKDQDLELKEQPFVFMDTHFINKGNALLEPLKKAIGQIKKLNGVAMVIWHNNHYETNEQKQLYNDVLELIAPN